MLCSLKFECSRCSHESSHQYNLGCELFSKSIYIYKILKFKDPSFFHKTLNSYISNDCCLKCQLQDWATLKFCRQGSFTSANSHESARMQFKMADEVHSSRLMVLQWKVLMRCIWNSETFSIGHLSDSSNIFNEFYEKWKSHSLLLKCQ